MSSVITEDSIVPFFVDVVCDSQKLCEVIQVKYSKINPEKMAEGLISDLSLSRSFSGPIISFIEHQAEEFAGLLSLVPSSVYAQARSAVHVLTVECGLNSIVYSDVFEWDIFDETASPDAFALKTVQELNLPVTFCNVISAQIRWQIIRLRAMHAYPEKLEEYIKTHPEVAPQSTVMFRSVSQLADNSPAIGMITGSQTKKTTDKRDRALRYYKRKGMKISPDALYPVDDLLPVSVKLVPVVRARPLPEDSTSIDLSMLSDVMDRDTTVDEAIVDKMRAKLEKLRLLARNKNADDDSESDESD